MKKYFFLLCLLSFFGKLNGQTFAISADKMNILYVGIDNPLSISVAKISNKSVVVKTSIGEVSGQNGQFIYRSDSVGLAEISLYKKTNNELVKIGSSFFRVKNISLPVFKIGPGKPSIAKIVLVNQEFVRAELENFDINARFPIDSFSVCIVPNDTCKFGVVKNIGNRINKEIRAEFQLLKEKDVIIFKNIFAKGPDGKSIELAPVMITIY